MKKTFRVFISSTFGDLEAERNALHRYVFPQLERLCAEKQCQFQPIDLRWGVRKEAALNQETMRICLNEIARCQNVTPRPNFIVLLGDRYGWQPLPETIPAEEFDRVLAQMTLHECKLLSAEVAEGGWYLRDDNVRPAAYVLRARSGAYTDLGAWQAVERQLHVILARAQARVALSGEQRLKYTASATHQEIAAGLFGPAGSACNVFCFSRVLVGLPAAPKPGAKLVPALARFLDEDGAGGWDEPADKQLRALRQNLYDALGDHYYEFRAAWMQDGITSDHLGSLPDDLLQAEKDGKYQANAATLCDAVWLALAGVIREELAQMEESDPAAEEDELHGAYGRARAAHFVGHVELQDRVLRYASSARVGWRGFRGLVDPLRTGLAHQADGNGGAGAGGFDPQASLLISGPSGVGKTAFLAQIAGRLRAGMGTPHVLARFVGATPASTDVRLLLSGLCTQLVRRLGLSGQAAAVPTEYPALAQTFGCLLAAVGSEQACVIFVDGLDQLSSTNEAGTFSWLPDQLPPYVRLVLSALPGEALAGLQKSLPASNIVELPPLDRAQAGTLLEAWLEAAGRRLTPMQAAQLLDNYARCPLPLHLRLACQEALHWRSYDEPRPLEDSTGALTEGILRRLSEDERHGRVLVECVLGYLASARYGLAEDEMLDVLARDTGVYARFLTAAHHLPPDLAPRVAEHLQGVGSALSPEAWLEALDVPSAEEFMRRLAEQGVALRLPYVVWSRLYYDLLPFLTERLSEGKTVFAFYHPSICESARRLFAGPGVNRELHLSLASYFESKLGEVMLQTAVHGQVMMALAKEGAMARVSLVSLPSRVLAELPWQLVEAGEWERLHALLAKDEYLYRIWLRSRYELRELWSRLTANSVYRLDETYAGVIADPAAHALVLDVVDTLLINRGGYEAAVIRMNEAMVRGAKDDYSRILALLRQANAYIEAGQHDKALELAQQAEREARAHKLDALEADGLYFQAQAKFHCDDCEAALAMITRHEAIERRIGNPDRINLCLKWKATILKKMNRLQEAMALYPHLAQSYEDNNDYDGLVACLFEGATAAYCSQQDFDTAFAMLERAEKIGLRNWVNRRWLRLLYISAAHMYAGVNLHAKTIEYFEKYLRMRQELGEDDTLEPYEAADYAIALAKSQHDEDALSLCERYEPLARARAPESRSARADLSNLLYAHLTAIYNLQPVWYTTMGCAKYNAYMKQHQKLHREREEIQKELKQMVPNATEALKLEMVRKIEAKAAEWNPTEQS